MKEVDKRRKDKKKYDSPNEIQFIRDLVKANLRV